MSQDAQQLMLEAVKLRGRALTVDQRKRREEVRLRSEAIARGVKQPKSGVWGRPPK